MPDGRHFFYLSYFGRVARDEAFGLYLGSLESKNRRLLLRTRGNAAYAPSSVGSSRGHLFFLRGNTLLARPFDAARLQFTGDEFPVAEEVQVFPAAQSASFSVSENGFLAYRSSTRGNLSQLAWFDRDGREIESVGAAADYYHPRISHDGRRIAVMVNDPQTNDADIWIFDLRRGVSTRLTFGPAVNLFPIWSPDDSRIVFASNRKGFHDLYQKAVSGTGEDELILSSESYKFPTDWSRAGELIAFHGTDTMSKSGSDIWVFSMADRKARPFLSTPFHEGSSQFSSDGQWIAYVSTESGRREVYVRPFSTSGGKWQISSAGGSFPRWRRDGKELFFVAPDKTLMAAEITAGSGFAAGVPRPLFRTQMKWLDIGFQYDVSADGKRFLINTLAEEEKSDAITIVQNWMAGLKNRWRRPPRLDYAYGSSILMHMRTTLILDDDLLEKARNLTGLKEKTAMVHAGLEALIARESARRLAALGASEPRLRAARRRRPRRSSRR
ncbi:MAG: type II toxin-antitoxin system VapB family antitoxin [Thermoanaerobaculia bacterium]